MEENNIYTEAGTYTPANLPSVDIFTPPSIGSVLGPELVNSAKVDAPLQLENVSPQVNAIVSDIRRNTLSTLRNMQNIENSRGSTYKDPNYAGDEIARSINPNHGKIKLTKNIPITETHEVLSDGVTWVPKYKYYKPGIDNDVLNTSLQTNSERFWNPIQRLQVKVTRGAIADIASFVYGIGEAAITGRAESIFDNSFARYVDDLDKKSDFAYKNYYTKEQSNLGFNNYTYDKVLGGSEFTLRMLGSEALIALATGGTSLPASLSRRFGQAALTTGRIASKAEELSMMGKYASKVIGLMQKPIIQTAGRTGMVLAGGGEEAVQLANAIRKGGRIGENLLQARFAVTGSMYEAGFEARHYRQEAENNFWEYYRQKGLEPSADDIKKFNDKVNNTEWGVFAANMAILSTSNLALFGNMLNIKNPFGKILGDGLSGVYDKSIGKIGTTLIDGSYKSLNANILNKAAAYAKPFAEGIFWEGIFEEGLQGVASNTYKNFVETSYDKNAMKNTKDFIDAFGKAFHDQYTGKEGLEEVVIGGIIGGLFGGIGGIRETTNKYNLAKNQATVLNAQKEFTDNLTSNLYTNSQLISLLAHNNRLQSILDKIDNSNDSFDKAYSSTEGLVSMLQASHSVEKEGQFKDVLSASIRGMDNTKLAEQYNISTEEANILKNDIADNMDKISEDYSTFREAGKYLFRGKIGGVEIDGKIMNPQNLIDAYAYINTMGKFSDRTASDTFSQFQKKLAESTTNSNIVEQFGTVMALKTAGQRQLEELNNLQKTEKELISKRDSIEKEIRELGIKQTINPELSSLEETRLKLSDDLNNIQQEIQNATSKKDTVWRALIDNFYKKLGDKGYLPQVDLDTFDTQFKNLKESFENLDLSEPDKLELEGLLNTFDKANKMSKSFQTLSKNLTNPSFRYKTYQGLFSTKRARNASVNDLTKDTFLQLHNIDTKVGETLSENIYDSPITNDVINELEEKGEVSDQYVQHVINRLYNNRTLTPNENKVYNEYKEDIDNEIKERKENPLEDISDDTIIDNNNIRIRELQKEIDKLYILLKSPNVNKNNNEEINKLIEPLLKQIQDIEDENSKLLPISELRNTSVKDQEPNSFNISDSTTMEELGKIGDELNNRANDLRLQVREIINNEIIKLKLEQDSLHKSNNKIELEKGIKEQEIKILFHIANKLKKEQDEIKDTHINMSNDSKNSDVLITEDIKKTRANKGVSNVYGKQYSKSEIQRFKNNDLYNINRMISIFTGIFKIGTLYTVEEIDELFRKNGYKLSKHDRILLDTFKDFAKKSGVKYTFDANPMRGYDEEGNYLSPKGYYNLDTHTIVFNIGNLIADATNVESDTFIQDRMSILMETFIHETIHSATAYAIENEKVLKDDHKVALYNLYNSFLREQKRYEKRTGNTSQSIYGFTNLDEYTANIAGERFIKELRLNRDKLSILLEAFGLKTSTVKDIIRNSKILSEAYDSDRALDPLETSDNFDNAIEQRYEDLEALEEGTDPVLNEMFKGLERLVEEYSDKYSYPEKEEDFEDMSFEDKLNYIKTNTDFYILDEEGNEILDKASQEEIKRFEELESSKDYSNPEYKSLKDKVQKSISIDNREFGGFKLSEIIELENEAKERRVITETQTQTVTPKKLQEFNEKTYSKSLQKDNGDPTMSQVYEGAYVKEGGKNGNSIHHIKLNTILNKSLEKGYSIVLEVFESGNKDNRVREKHIVTSENIEDISNKFDSISNITITLKKGDSEIKLTKPNHISHFSYVGDLLNLLDLKPYYITGQSSGYILLYKDNIDGTISPINSEFTITRNGIQLPFDREESNNLKPDDEVELIYDPEDDYNKNLSKNSRNKMARIYVMSNNKLIGVLKSTDNNTDNANWKILHAVRKKVIESYDNNKPNEKVSISQYSHKGLPIINLDSLGNPIEYDLQNEDVESFGYVNSDGNIILENEVGYFDSRYVNGVKNSKSFPIAVIKYGSGKFAFPINIKTINVGEKAVQEFDNYMNNDSLTIEQKRLRINGLLEKYNVGDKSLYWKSNKNTSTQIRESLSNAVETVNIMNFNKVKTSDKSINIDLKNPFFAGKFRLNFTDIIDPDIVSINTVTKEVISQSVYDNFKSKNKIHPATLKSILNKVDNGTQLSLREQEMFDFYKKTELVSSTKMKSKSNKGKDKSNENTCK